MELEKIKERLCYYENERQNLIDAGIMEADEIEQAKINCYCDNCFYGRTPLAKEILRLRALLNLNT